MGTIFRITNLTEHDVLSFIKKSKIEEKSKT